MQAAAIGQVGDREAGVVEGRLRGAGEGAQPEIMGMFEHAQALAAIELDSELGGQGVQRSVVLQQG